MTSAWLRPYSPGRGRWLIVAWELAGLAFFGWTTVRLFDLGLRSAAVLTGGLGLLWLLGAWQIMRSGVYVGESGIRVRGLIGSRTLRWHEIEHFVIDRISHRIGGLEIPSGTTVLIKRRNGGLVHTPLWAQGIDFHARPAAFREVYQILRDLHTEALAPPHPKLNLRTA